MDLFTHRARAVDRRFNLSEANAAAVAEICRSLDGVPLSLEMAAARVPSLGVEGLRASLEARLQVLSAGLRTSDVRHQTLRSMAEWSVGLLDETEALVFRRLGIFAGGFSLDAAMAVAAEGEINRWTVADALARLVDKSVVTLERLVPPRYRILESLRLYARQVLHAAGEWERLAERHALHFCAVFAPANDAWQTKPVPMWQSMYMPELDNLRSALGWALADPARIDLAVELNASTCFIWYEWGLVEEGWSFLAPLRQALDDRSPSASVAAIRRSIGARFHVLGDVDEAEREYALSATVARDAGDELGFALANQGLAVLMFTTDRYSQVGGLIRGARETLTAKGQKRALGGAMSMLGGLAMYEGDFSGAVDSLRISVALARQLKDSRREEAAVSNLALAEFSRGDTDQAIETGREAVTLGRLFPNDPQCADALENLAMYLVAADRLSEARPVAEEALSLAPVRAESTVLLRRLQQWALIAALDGEAADAARLIGWVDAAYRRTDVPRNQWEAKSYDRLRSKLSSRLGEAELSALAVDGSRWDADWAVNFTFDRIIRRGAEAPASPRG